MLVIERCTPVADALFYRILPSHILIGIQVLVDRCVGLFDLGTGGRLEGEMQVLGKVPSQGEITVPQELLGECKWQVLILQTLQVALLQFVVVTRHLGIERDALGQVVQTYRLGEVEPLRLTLEFLKRLPGLIHGRVSVVQGATPLVFTLVNGGLTRGVTMGMTVREREVGGIVRHRMTLGFQSPAQVRQREVGVTCFGNGNTLDAVALVLVGGTLQGIAQAHIRIERIITWAHLLVTHRVVQWRTYLGLVGEELTQL